MFPLPQANYHDSRAEAMDEASDNHHQNSQRCLGSDIDVFSDRATHSATANRAGRKRFATRLKRSLSNPAMAAAASNVPSERIPPLPLIPDDFRHHEQDASSPDLFDAFSTPGNGIVRTRTTHVVETDGSEQVFNLSFWSPPDLPTCPNIRKKYQQRPTSAMSETSWEDGEQASGRKQMNWMKRLGSRADFRRKYKGRASTDDPTSPLTPTPHTAPLLSTARFSPPPNPPGFGSLRMRPRSAINEQTELKHGHSSALGPDSPSFYPRANLPPLPTRRELSHSTVTSPAGYTYVQSTWVRPSLETVSQPQSRYIPRTPSQIEASVEASTAKAAEAQAKLTHNKNPLMDKKRQKELEAALVQLGSEFYRRCSVTGSVVQRDSPTMQSKELVRLMLKHGLQYDDVKLAITEWYAHKQEQDCSDNKKAARRAFIEKAVSFVRNGHVKDDEFKLTPRDSREEFDRVALHKLVAYSIDTVEAAERHPTGDGQQYGLGIEYATADTNDFQGKQNHPTQGAAPMLQKDCTQRQSSMHDSIFDDTGDGEHSLNEVKKPRAESAFLPRGHAELNSYLDTTKYEFVPRRSAIGVPTDRECNSLYSFDDSASDQTIVAEESQPSLSHFAQCSAMELKPVDTAERKASVLPLRFLSDPPESRPSQEDNVEMHAFDYKKDWETTDRTVAVCRADGDTVFDRNAQTGPRPSIESELDHTTEQCAAHMSKAASLGYKALPESLHKQECSMPGDHDFDSVIGVWADNEFRSAQCAASSPRLDHDTRRQYVLPPLDLSKTGTRPDSAVVPLPLRLPICPSPGEKPICEI